MAVIHVVGLGPGDEASLPVGTVSLLRSGRPVYVRTFVHPVMDVLLSEGLLASSFDYMYETGQRFEDIYHEMANELLGAAKTHGEIVYAVPGHPLMAEQSVQNLLEQAPAAGVEVRIGPGHSFVDDVCGVLHIDPIQGLTILDGTRFNAHALHPGLHTLIVQVFNRAVASDVKLTLMDVLPDEYQVKVVRAAGVAGSQRVEAVALYDLDRLEWIDHLTTVYVPPTNVPEILRGEAWYVADLVRRLRAPDGCPWDRAQTHSSLRPYVLEEAYEVAEAIDGEDEAVLADELGDLWLQILLHAEIASENGTFTVRDVYGALADKLLRRHPHVFGDVKAASVEAAQASWQQMKAAERAGGGAEVGAEVPSALSGIKWAQPASLVSRELQTAAASLGFDWPSLEGVTAKVSEELNELADELAETELAPRAADRIREEFGDVLFTVVNLARWLNVDVEQALALSNRKFFRRFTGVEKLLRENGQDLGKVPLNVLETYWNQIKVEENDS